MKVKIDKNKCIGCGTCTAVAPKSFQLGDNGKAQPIDPPTGEAGPAGDDQQLVLDAVESCPVGAIEVEN